MLYPTLMPPRPTASTTSHAPSLPQRLLGLDSARLIATLGVIWFHSIECDTLRPSGVLGRFSVAFYTLAAMIFLIQSADRRRRPIPAYLLDRLRRLGIPFLGWSLITVATMYAVVATGYPLDLPALSWNMLADGGTLHLWYLPFLFVASAIVYPAVTLTADCPAARWILAAAAITLALALDCGLFDAIPQPTWPVIGRFLEVTADRWSAVYWGLAAAILYATTLRHSRWRIVLALAGAILLIATTAYQWRFGLISQLKIYGGLGLLALSLPAWNTPLVRLLAPLGRLSAGMYFAHMAAIYAIRDLLMAAAIPHGPARDTLVFLLATVLSLALVFTLSRLPALRWLVDDARPRNIPPPAATV